MNFKDTFKCRFTDGFEKQYFWKVFWRGWKELGEWVAFGCIIRNDSKEIGKTVKSIMKEKERL